MKKKHPTKDTKINGVTYKSGQLIALNAHVTGFYRLWQDRAYIRWAFAPVGLRLTISPATQHLCS